MKLKFFVSSSIVAALLLLSAHSLNDGEEKNQVLLKLMMQGMTYYHYQPQDVDDDFSSNVFHQYIKRLDYNKRFFTARDVENLSRYEHLLDEEINEGTYELFDLSLNIFNKRVEEAEAYYKEILAEPFDFTKKEQLINDVEKMDFAANEAAVRERWRSILKYQTLSKLVESLEKQEKAQEDDDSKVEIKTFDVLESEARSKVLKNNNSYFRRLKKLDRDDRMADYMNSIAMIFDPHTGYFPPKDKENFDISMSGQLEGIGARLSEGDGNIKVVHIVPGSACYRQGDLEVGDVIIKVGQAAEEAVDVVDMDLDDAIKLIRGKKGTEVRLTVRKIDNREMLIPIVRDVVQLEETYAKSLILKSDVNQKKIGYIDLPKFYANFNSKDGRRCATDVAIEIEKLQKENIEGLILDLRDNGGGSLNDVVEMAGLFIKEGPIVQVKSRNRAPRILEDQDPHTQYDGPLVVMVNSFSASASEILAAAIQDYGRGVIVGSQSTFGKGTVQRFVNLDNFLRGDNQLKPLGEMKLTTQKFYRINGDATQLKGVIPDIVLPDAYNLIDLGEKEREFSMQWDEIEPVRYDKWGHLYSDVSTLRAQSEQRVADNPTFKLIEENAVRLKNRRENHRYMLNLQDFRAEKQQLEEESKKYDEIQQDISGFYISNLKADADKIATDSIYQERQEKWIGELQKDPYVYEVLSIMKDMQ